VTSPAAPTSAVPSLVTVHAADVHGLTFADARARLSALGLVVARADEQRADVAPGLVTAVDPVGGLLPGRTVTLTVAAAPPAPATTSAPSTPPPAAVVTAPAPAPATQAKAPAPVTQTKGRGSNKGHGKKDDD
jgi:serine/threonine-protein kinase